ncbi:MAG: hypothetical protein V8S95_09325 [Odoribacter sp.]
MGLTASLDIGNEKIVMALAAVEHVCRLVGIKIKLLPKEWKGEW